MKIWIYVAILWLICGSMQAEWVNGDSYDNGAQLVLLQQAIVEQTEQTAKIEQAVYVLCGLVLVQLTVHAWRV